MWIALIAAVAVLIVAGVAVTVWLRRGNQSSSVKPYREIRRDLIHSIGNAESEDPAPPARPTGLDCRLPGSLAAELRTVWPVDDENYSRALDILYEIANSIRDELDQIDDSQHWYELLSPERRAVLVVDTLEAEINNGGFDQYFLNSSGDGAHAAPDSLRLLGLEELAEMVERANSLFDGGPSQFRSKRLVQLDAMGESQKDAMNDLDSEFFAIESGHGGISMTAAIPFILQHESSFFQP